MPKNTLKLRRPKRTKLGRKNAMLSRREQLLRSVRRFIDAGLAILPLEPCTPDLAGSGKRPITPNGVKNATKDYERFLQLVGDRTDFNIGIATGAINDLVVIDVDPRNGGRHAMRCNVEAYGKLPKGPVTNTGGGGYHRYFRFADLPAFNGTKLGEGVDIKADNGYVVAPSSMHASGKRYLWREGRRIDKIKTPGLPPRWQAAITGKLKPSAGPELTAPVVSDIPAVILEGTRNTTLTSIAGALCARGLNAEQLEAELLKINTQRCQPPLDDGEVRKIANSGKRWINNEKIDDMGAGEVLAKELLNRDFASGAHLRFERDGNFYLFCGTHWSPIAEDDLLRRINGIIRAGHPSQRKRMVAAANETLALLRIEVGSQHDALHFVTAPPPVINVLNGEVWLLPDGSHELRPHSPATGSRHVLEVAYDPKAECPIYDGALKQILSKHSNPDRVARVLHQLIAYIIQPDRPRAIIVVFVGGGGNGKSKLAQTIAKLLGPNTVYSGDVTRLESSPFGIGGLANKLLFLDDDVKAGAKLPDGVLKKLSEGKEVTGERKHKDPFNFINRAIPMLLFNNVPAISDLSEGIRRRLMVFQFDRRFQANEQDVTLFDRIWDKELPGILNHALRGWQQFVSNGHKFSESKDLEKALQALLIQANPLPAFIADCYEPSSKGKVKVADMYSDYVRWAEDNGYKFNVVRNKMISMLRSLGYTVNNTKGYPCVYGLALREKDGAAKGLRGWANVKYVAR